MLELPMLHEPNHSKNVKRCEKISSMYLTDVFSHLSVLLVLNIARRWQETMIIMGKEPSNLIQKQILEQKKIEKKRVKTKNKIQHHTHKQKQW